MHKRVTNRVHLNISTKVTFDYNIDLLSEIKRFELFKILITVSIALNNYGGHYINVDSHIHCIFKVTLTFNVYSRLKNYASVIIKLNRYIEVQQQNPSTKVAAYFNVFAIETENEAHLNNLIFIGTNQMNCQM